MTQDTKLNLLFIKIFFVLLLFGNLLKYFSYNLIVIIDFLTLIMFFKIIIRKKITISNGYLFLFLTVLFHFFYQFVLYPNILNYDYINYRNLFRGLILLIFLINIKFENENEYKLFYHSIFKMIVILISLNILIEYYLVKVLLIDIRGFPYLETVYQDTPFNYGKTNSLARVPTLLGAPHLMGEIMAPFLIYYLHIILKKDYLKYSSKFFNIFCFIILLISFVLLSIRTSILSFTIVIVLYFLLSKKKINVNIFFVGIISIFFYYIFNNLHNFILSSEGMIDTLIYDYKVFNKINFDLFEFPDYDRFFFLLIGLGGVTGNEQYNGFISLLEIETPVFTNILPQYGLIFLIAYIYFILKITKNSFKKNQILSYMLIPYLFNLIHLWNMESSFTVDVFFLQTSFLILLKKYEKKI